MIPTRELIGIPVTCLDFEEQIMLILRWCKMGESKVVCLANVHMIMEAYGTPEFADLLKNADLVTPDGRPLVFMLRRMGIRNQDQVAGFDVFQSLCGLSEQVGLKVFFLGSTKAVLQKMRLRLNQDYPVLQIAGMEELPQLSIEEIEKNQDQNLIDKINQSGAEIVFVCLGCPKQEVWMSQYRGSINAVMIGVGAVFSMYAGGNPRAPYLIQKVYLEWLYRLLQEPNRLWKRHASSIPTFVYLATKQLVSLQINSPNKLSPRALMFSDDISENAEILDSSPEKIGTILVRQKVVTSGQLDEALQHQKLNPTLKIGEILFRNNHLSLPQLRFYLRNQNIKLGRILLKKKYLSQRSLNDVLSLQKDSQKMLGQLLVQQKIVSQYKLAEALSEQYLRRKGLFLMNSEDNL